MRHSAQKILSKINRQEQERIIAAINSLTNTPRPAGCKKLSGRPAWRIRIGSYRIIYEIQDNKLIVTVVHIGHRREVYR
ncbi:MAG: type II toxin-antitoxin system RelE/ParE family toxin [Spirochaetaceae bacterium]|nr:type II toxin-antitoxin system RelE/ParE family toxin [Spirochaetaceae bacterium]